MYQIRSILFTFLSSYMYCFFQVDLFWFNLISIHAIWAAPNPHLRNKVKSINTFAQYYMYDYIISWLGGGKSIISILRTEWSLFVKPYVSFTKVCFVRQVLEKNNFKVGFCIFVICFLYLLGKDRGSSFDETWIPFI